MLFLQGFISEIEMAVLVLYLEPVLNYSMMFNTSKQSARPLPRKLHHLPLSFSLFHFYPSVSIPSSSLLERCYLCKSKLNYMESQGEKNKCALEETLSQKVYKAQR